MKNYEMLMQQEKMTQRWKTELEQAVEKYEQVIKKLKKENRILRRDVEQQRNSFPFMNQ